jgi:hypothetical protein
MSPHGCGRVARIRSPMTLNHDCYGQDKARNHEYSPCDLFLCEFVLGSGKELKDKSPKVVSLIIREAELISNGIKKPIAS